MNEAAYGAGEQRVQAQASSLRVLFSESFRVGVDEATSALGRAVAREPSHVSRLHPIAYI